MKKSVCVDVCLLCKKYYDPNTSKCFKLCSSCDKVRNMLSTKKK